MCHTGKYHSIKISRQKDNYYVCMKINNPLMPLLSWKVNGHEYVTCTFFSLLLPYCFSFFIITAFLHTACKTFGKELCLHVSIKAYYEGTIIPVV